MPSSFIEVAEKLLNRQPGLVRIWNGAGNAESMEKVQAFGASAAKS